MPSYRIHDPGNGDPPAVGLRNGDRGCPAATSSG